MEKDDPKITNMKEKIDSMKKRIEKMREIKKTMDTEKVDEISLTDPEARLMKTRHGVDVCFNGQMSVDQKNHSHSGLRSNQRSHGLCFPCTADREFKGIPWIRWNGIPF
jgi:TolA-binding protein